MNRRRAQIRAAVLADLAEAGRVGKAELRVELVQVAGVKTGIGAVQKIRSVVRVDNGDGLARAVALDAARGDQIDPVGCPDLSWGQPRRGRRAQRRHTGRVERSGGSGTLQCLGVENEVGGLHDASHQRTVFQRLDREPPWDAALRLASENRSSNARGMPTPSTVSTRIAHYATHAIVKGTVATKSMMLPQEPRLTRRSDDAGKVRLDEQTSEKLFEDGIVAPPCGVRYRTPEWPSI